MPMAAVHHWIVVLDIESFSARSDPLQRSLRAAMYDVLHAAVEQAGIPGDALSTEDRGDGVLILFQAQVPPVQLAGALVRALDDCLREKAAVFSEAHAMRFRVALHQGLVSRDARGWSGDAVNTAFRLVDAAPLRDVLSAAGRARLAFIASDEVYRAVIRHDHRTVDPAAYLPVTFEAKHGVEITGWVTVPGYPSPPGLAPGAGAPGTGTPRSGTYAAGAPGAPSPAGGGPAAPAERQGRPNVVFHIGEVHGDPVAGDKHVHHHSGGPVRP
ncbi:hypothetical protein ACFXKJ_28130 [Kitasatospora indigofera]|uniref:hypothetical protein n=1 Tax=Kitasatospora indigofera TaxID=67307 RepID=UPI00362DCDD0